MTPLFIKNMVCPRCIDTVRDIFNQLEIETSHIELGKVTTVNPVEDHQKQVLNDKLKSRGFELLEDKTSKIIARIKSTIIEQIHYSTKALTINFSTLISERVGQDYTSISKLFSAVEGVTIEKFVLKMKIEKVKELIVYDELSLSEIAFKLGYSSVAHLSSQFKKETGMTPSAFRKLEIKGRNSLDSL